MKLLEIILVIFLPPVSVALKVGIGRQAMIALVLQMLGQVPGVVYAFWVITRERHSVVEMSPDLPRGTP